jgi:hypothetical protein
MGRLAGFGSAAGMRRGVVLAFAMGSTVALMTASALADTTPVPKKTKHSSHHSSSADTASSKPGDTCKPTPDQASIGIRALQTELMVAGLKCSAEQWNSFTAKFKATLKSDADRMQHLFSKSYGKSGPNEMNTFVTSLANEASQRSNGYSEADYCKQEDVLFQKVLTLTSLELERFSVGRKLNVQAPVALCTPDPDGPAATTTAAAGTPNSATPNSAAPNSGSATAASGATATVAVSTTPPPAGTTVSTKR